MQNPILGQTKKGERSREMKALRILRKSIGFLLVAIAFLVTWPIRIATPLVGLAFVVWTFIQEGIIAGLVCIVVVGLVAWGLEFLLALIIAPIGLAAAFLFRG